MGDDRETVRGDGSRSKVARSLRHYDLAGLGDELERLWVGDGGERRSLRDLADYFNRTLLEAEMDRAGMDTLDGEVENIYRLLTADDVSSGTRVRTRQRLERNGIDVDRLEGRFVSHQAVHTYLTEHRDVRYSSDTGSTEDLIGRRVETIQRLRSRAMAVTERILRTLSDTGRITLGDFEVFVDIRIHCRSCGTAHDVDDILTSRGCECDPGTE